MSRDIDRAKRLYKTFHQFEPIKVGEFHRDFKIPRRAMRVGRAHTMYYTSDKLNPETGKDEGPIKYFHEHGPSVFVHFLDMRGIGIIKPVPPRIYTAKSLVLIGQCDGFDYEDEDGGMRKARGVGRKPEWYCIPSGKALLVVQDKRKVLALVWGGKLRIEWRGVVN